MLVASTNRSGLRISDLEDQRNLLSAILASEAESQHSFNQETVVGNQESLHLDLNTNELAMETFDSQQLHDILEEPDDEVYDYIIPQSIVNRLAVAAAISSATTSATLSLISLQEKLKEGGNWYQLPNVLVDLILCYLGDADMCGYLLMTSKSTFQPDEVVYRFICEYVYTHQSVRKACSIEHWKTWRNMLIYRPRLRTNGFYTLRTLLARHITMMRFGKRRYMNLLRYGTTISHILS